MKQNNKHKEMKTRMKYGITALVIGLGFMAVTSCSRDKSQPGLEYMPNMYRAPHYSTFEASPLFENGSALRPVEGTVPRGYTTYEEPNTPEAFTESMKRKGYPKRLTPFSEEDSLEGSRLYGIYCSPCHGGKGDGQGTLVENDKIAGVPSYDSTNRPDLSTHSIFHVITHGKGIMGSHAAQIQTDDRWKIVSYVMKLREELDQE